MNFGEVFLLYFLSYFKSNVFKNFSIIFLVLYRTRIFFVCRERANEASERAGERSVLASAASQHAERVGARSEAE
jgi:hypothetical protein